MVTGRRPPLREVKALYDAMVAREGVTTLAGAVIGNSIFDAGLIGFGVGSFEGMLAEVYPGQPNLVDSFDIPAGGFNNITGEITFSTNYKGGQIPAGVPYKIVTFRFVPAEVAILTGYVGWEGATSLANKLTLARATLLDQITALRMAELDPAGLPADVAAVAAQLVLVLADTVALLADVGDASTSTLGSLYAILGDPPTDISHVLDHVCKFTGESYWVDGTNGNDANSGTDPHDAKRTIGAAIGVAAAGDRIYARAGTYDEALNLNLVGLELVCEQGTILSNSTPGTVLIASANYCRVVGVILAQAGQTGLQVTGNFCSIEDSLAFGCAVGFDDNGAETHIVNCRSILHTTTGFDISVGYGQYERCVAGGGGAAVRGIYLSNAAADHNHFFNCHTLGNTTAGWEVVAGADSNQFSHCSMGAADGAKVDAGANNTWDNFSEGSQIVAGQSRDQDLADIHTIVNTIPTEHYFEQNLPILMNTTQTLNNVAADKDFIASNATGADGLVSADDTKVQKIMLVIIGRAVNSYAGNNALDCTTATHNQWKINLDGGAYLDLVNEEADGQMLDNDWQAIGEGAIHPFTFMFDVTTQVTNIDGKIGVRLENGRSEQTSFIVTIDVYLKVLWRL